jgi:hypothetical protein
MTGWKIETTGSSISGIRPFERDHRWFCYDSGVFDCVGYGLAEARSPWTTLCEHFEQIIRWIPPTRPRSDTGYRTFASCRRPGSTALVPTQRIGATCRP